MFFWNYYLFFIADHYSFTPSSVNLSESKKTSNDRCYKLDGIVVISLLNRLACLISRFSFDCSPAYRQLGSPSVILPSPVYALSENTTWKTLITGTGDIQNKMWGLEILVQPYTAIEGRHSSNWAKWLISIRVLGWKLLRSSQASTTIGNKLVHLSGIGPYYSKRSFRS